MLMFQTPSLDGLSSDPQDRLTQIRKLWQQFPGRAPGGTGPTGLLSNDAQGWSDMLNQQTEAVGLDDQLSGRPGPTIRTGRSIGTPPSFQALGLDPNDPTPLAQQLRKRGR